VAGLAVDVREVVDLAERLLRGSPVRALQSRSASSKTRFQQLACKAAVEVSTPSRSKRKAS